MSLIQVTQFENTISYSKDLKPFCIAFFFQGQKRMTYSYCMYNHHNGPQLPALCTMRIKCVCTGSNATQRHKEEQLVFADFVINDYTYSCQYLGQLKTVFRKFHSGPTMTKFCCCCSNEIWGRTLRGCAYCRCLSTHTDSKLMKQYFVFSLIGCFLINLPINQE